MSDRDTRFNDLSESTQATPTVVPTVAGIPLEPVPAQPIVEAAAPAQKEKTFARMQNKLHRMHLFSAYSEDPLNVTFQTQEPDEHILLFLRKSQWVNTPWIVGTLILAVIPLGIYILRSFFNPFIPPLNILLVIIPFYYLFVATYGFVNFVTWYYNAALITDKRVVDIDFHQIVLKDVAETKLSLVQDVSYKQDGVIPNMFGHGFVLIQTAGTLDNFEFHNLPQPAQVVELIEGLIGERRTYEP